MRWHIWHRAPGTEMWCHSDYSSHAEAIHTFDHWVMAGHEVQIKEGSYDNE